MSRKFTFFLQEELVLGFYLHAVQTDDVALNHTTPKQPDKVAAKTSNDSVDLQNSP